MLSVFIIYLGRWSLGLKFQKVENPWALSQENLAIHFFLRPAEGHEENVQAVFVLS